MKNKHFLRGLALALCLSMILGFAPAGILNANAAEADAPVSLVPNGNFEQKVDDWAGAGWRGNRSYVVFDAERNSNVAKVEDLVGNTYDEEGALVQRGTAAEIISDKFPVSSGVTYKISFWYKQDAAATEIATHNYLPLSIQWFGDDGVRIDPAGDGPDSGKDYYTAINPALSTEWQKYEGTVMVPVEATQAWIQLGVDTAGINILLIDDIDFVKSDVTFTENFNRGIFDYGWTKSAGANAMIYDHSVEGRSLILQTKSGVWAQSPAIPVIAGYTYNASFMHSKTSYDKGATYSVGSGGRAAIIYTNERGAVLSETVITVGEQNGWEQANLSARAPANSVYMYIKYFVDASYTGDPCFSIDDLTVTETVGEILQPVEIPLIANGDFAKGSEGWKIAGTASVNEDGQAFIPADETAPASFSTDYISTKPNEVFTVSAKAMRTSGAKDGYLGFWYYDAAGKIIDAVAVRIGGSEEWKDYELLWTVPEGVASFRVEFGTNSKANTALLVDDVKLVMDKNAVLSNNFDGAIETTKWNDGKDRSNSLPAGWTPDAYEQIRLSLISGKWGAKDGNMLFLQAAGWIKSPSFDVTPGLTYTVSYDEMDYMVATTKEVTNEETGETETVVVKNTGGYVMLVFVDADGNVVDSKAVSIKDAETALEWSSNAFEALAPEGAVAGYVEIGYSKVDGDAIFGIDNLIIKNNYVKPDNTIVAPTYPEYHEDFEGIGKTYVDWVGNYEVTADGMKLNGTVRSARFLVTAGNTYNIVAEGAEVAIVFYDEPGAVLEADGFVAPEGAYNAVITLTGTDVVISSVAVYEEAPVTGPVQDDKAKFSSTGLSLGTFIGMQSLVQKKNMNGGTFDEAYFIYTHNGFDADGNPVATEVRGEYIISGNYYIAECPVNAKQMADIFDITPYYVVDGITYRGVTTSTSVKEQAMKSYNSSKTDEQSKAVCAAMLNYGAEAQKQFKYNLDNLANSELAADVKVLPAFADLNLVKVNNIPTEPFKPASNGLSLGDVVYMQFMIKKTNVDANGSMTYQIGNEEAVAVAIADLETYGKNYYVINIALKAKYVRSDVKITLPGADGAAYTMTCSVEAFAAALEGKATENLVNALMVYGDAAQVKFG